MRAGRQKTTGSRTARRAAALAVSLALVAVPATAVALPSGGALPSALTLVIPISDAEGVPDGAVGVALNVTVTNASGAGFLTVYSCDSVVPETSNLNYVKDQTVPNLVFTALGPSRAVCIDTFATADVVVDLSGYVPASSTVTMLATPQRFLDTREGIGAVRAQLRGGTELAVSIAGTPGVPASASAVVFNATAVEASAAGFLTVYPCGQPRPDTSTLNFKARQIVPNLVVSRVGAGGSVCLYANVDTDVVGDVAGYVGADGSGLSLLANPQRIVDTRYGVGGAAQKVTLGGRSIQVAGGNGVPAGATAALVNLTATQGSAAGWVAAYPCDVAPPEVSNLNFGAKTDVANAAVVKLAADGSFCVRANQPVDLIIDLVGFTTGSTAVMPLPPSRLYDSRDGAVAQCNLGVGVRSGGFEILNLATGAIEGTLSGPVGVTSNIWISPDCSLIGVGGPPGLTLYNRSGAKVAEFEDTRVYVTDLGPVEYDIFNGLVLGGSPRETMFALPDALLGATLVDVSRDGSTYLFLSQGRFHLFSDVGVDLGLTLPNGVTTEIGNRAPRLAPSGWYVTYFEASSGSYWGDWIVATIDGTVVDRFPLSAGTLIMQPPRWVTDGMLVLGRIRFSQPRGGQVGYNSELMRWELFNPPTIISSSNAQEGNYLWTYTMWAGR
jgi:hypothetical protein